ncbi:hypothetical protein RG963_08755 [Methanosarcina sp. Z-7115]|uniref:DUF305 domain-containing protein n=1 Tax=Methanosarcina baikalica TaxID=3073890 RepID=A0ABU2D1M1_9EURY|nr:hypothetical protein [Methanosarcina sp. Z-7115]MDR7665858.1 hypothetical protein [Methanosarcina sp. Z-7115]
MIKSGILKSALLLLALITVIVIALAEPIAGHMMGQGNIMGQQSMIIVCSDNQTCTVIQSSMGDHSSNETMIHCMPGNDSMMMGNLSVNETMMQCMLGNDSMMMGNLSANETMMQCMLGNDSMMGNLSANETMMHCMMENDSMMNGSCCIIEMDQSASAAQARLDCAQFWLEQAIEMHEMHLKDPSTATNESQLEMMNQMMWAYECIVGENMTKNMTQNTTLEMMNTTAGPELRGYYRTYAIELRNY